jgi:hypothetical protein
MAASGYQSQLHDEPMNAALYWKRFNAFPVSGVGELLLHVVAILNHMDNFLRNRQVHHRLPNPPIMDEFIDRLNLIYDTRGSLFMWRPRGCSRNTAIALGPFCHLAERAYRATPPCMSKWYY